MFGSIFNCNCPIRYNIRFITLLITYSCGNNGWFDFLLEYVFQEMSSICTSGSEAIFRFITLLITYSCGNNGWFDFLLEYVFQEMSSICTSGSEAIFVLTVIRRSLQDMHL